MQSYKMIFKFDWQKVTDLLKSDAIPRQLSLLMLRWCCQYRAALMKPPRSTVTAAKRWVIGCEIPEK